MPVSTVRYLKSKWNEEGVPPAVVDALPAVLGNFVEDAERVRDKLLVALEKAVDDGKITPREIVPALGMLQDKIRALRGLDTKKVEHTLSLPNADEVRSLFAGVIQEVVHAAETRSLEVEDADIEDADYEPADVLALVQGSDTEVTS